MMDHKEYSCKKENKDKKMLEKKSYAKPEISELGSMVKVTLGGSVISGDSGQGVELQN